MKKILFVLLTIAISNLSIAQYNPEAERYLDQIAENVKSADGLSFDFNIKVTHIENNKLLNTTNGSLLLKKGRYKLSYDGVNTYSDGKNQWIHLIEENEVTIQAIEEGELSPITIFTIYKDGYRYRILNEDNEMVLIELSPENQENSEYIRITISINKKDSKIESFNAQSKTGHISNITITSWQNKTINDDVIIFSPDMYPDIEIIDLR